MNEPEVKCPRCEGQCVAEPVPGERPGVSLKFSQRLTVDRQHGLNLMMDLVGARREFRCQACGELSVLVLERVNGKQEHWWQDPSGTRLP